MINKMTIGDPFGQAIEDYYQKPNKKSRITVLSSIAEKDFIPVPYLFRNFKEMPELEQIALKNASGKTLDIGCGAGSHLKYFQENNIDAFGIDISSKAVEVCKLQGLKAAKADFFEFNGEKFDTLLLMMNGIGICGTIERLNDFFSQCKNLLNENGQIILDSSDIIYMFENEEGEYWINLNDKYYGEVEYKMQYKNISSKPFDWLFVDYNTLQFHADNHGFKTELVKEGEHFDYLAKLTLK